MKSLTEEDSIVIGRDISGVTILALKSPLFILLKVLDASFC